MKYSMIVAALALAVPSFATQAETVTYTASQCNLNRGEAQIDHHRGYVQNYSPLNSFISCPINVEQGRDIENVDINVMIVDKKSNHSSSCNISFYDAKKSQLHALKTTENATAFQETLSVGPFLIATEQTRGVLSCNLPGVEENGVARIFSYSVTYM